MRLRFILWTQSFLTKWYGADWCKTNIVFSEYFRKTRDEKKDLAFVEKAEKSYEKDLVNLSRLIDRRFDKLAEANFESKREMDAMITMQNEKIQTLQDGILERVTQNDKKLEVQLKELEEHSNQRLNFISADLLQKS